MVMNSAEALHRVFSKNRTEELGHDVWRHFVVPPFYDRLDLQDARKPRVIVGGRGCGKTMLLRYLSHESTFSSDRPDVPIGALSHIGLYWRVDTQFARVMSGRGLPDETWVAAFDHLLAIVIGLEVLRSMRGISRSNIGGLPRIHLEAVKLRRLAPFDPSFDCNPIELESKLDVKLAEFELWIANVKKVSEPIFLPGRNFLLFLIRDLQEQLSFLANAIFFVYLDEFENLLEIQQRAINTCLKHSESPLIFNLAMKRNGFGTTGTLGEESINDIADYRTHDLERYLLEGDFQLFAAEVLFHNLTLAGLQEESDIPRLLRDPSLLSQRREERHRSLILRRVGEMFPNLSHEELAETVFADEALHKTLLKKVSQALVQRKSNLEASMFVRPAQPQASIIIPALLSRKQATQEILEELDKLDSGFDNRFTGKTNWIHNNFIGALLSLYESYPRACPFYAGFTTFCLLARGNMRHFLELCHKSLNQVARSVERDGWTVPPADQASAARQVSADFLGEIRSFGRYGNRLHVFVLRLGSLFALAHTRPSQSEPEQCHFAVTRGKAISEEDNLLLVEAVKWSVLFEDEATKVKDEYQAASFEYVLNPIYSPYFHISYRKRRRLEITSDELHVLIGGSYEEVASLLRRYSAKWSVSLRDANQMLFAHLLGEG
jgi:hypothetical protein